MLWISCFGVTKSSSVVVTSETDFSLLSWPSYAKIDSQISALGLKIAESGGALCQAPSEHFLT